MIIRTIFRNVTLLDHKMHFKSSSIIHDSRCVQFFGPELKLELTERGYIFFCYTFTNCVTLTFFVHISDQNGKGQIYDNICITSRIRMTAIIDGNRFFNLLFSKLPKTNQTFSRIIDTKVPNNICVGNLKDQSHSVINFLGVVVICF